jgi:uncharacterized membrane protein YgcG
VFENPSGSPAAAAADLARANLDSGVAMQGAALDYMTASHLTLADVGQASMNGTPITMPGGTNGIVEWGPTQITPGGDALHGGDMFHLAPAPIASTTGELMSSLGYTPQQIADINARNAPYDEFKGVDDAVARNAADDAAHPPAQGDPSHAFDNVAQPEVPTTAPEIDTHGVSPQYTDAQLEQNRADLAHYEDSASPPPEMSAPTPVESSPQNDSADTGTSNGGGFDASGNGGGFDGGGGGGGGFGGGE